MLQKTISETVRSMEVDLGSVDVVILCGGRGERLSPVLLGRPKVLAKIGKQAFLDILIGQILRFGFKHIILCVGYLKEQVISHFNQDRHLNVEFSEEEIPLGTGGAVKAARPFIKSQSFLVLNGDSICNINYHDFYRFHLENRGLISMVTVRPKKHQGQEVGIVRLDDASKIVGFKEKVDGEVGGYINAGVYLMRSEIFDCMPGEANFSLEYDLFENMLDKGCYGFNCESELIDIGTPERYKYAVGQLNDPA